MINDQWKLDFMKMLGDVSRWTEAIAFKQKNMPNSLYKYKAVSDYSLEGLREGSIWLNNPNDFNDPYDSSFNLNYKELPQSEKSAKLDEAMKTIIQNLEKAQKHNSIKIIEKAIAEGNESLINSFNKQVKDRFHKVICFSERRDSILMWSHYSNNHKGFCIEYEANDKIWDGSLSRCLFPVIYDNKLIDISDYLKSDDVWDRFLSFFLPLFYKGEDWAYEKEWRYVLSYGTHEGNSHKAPPVKAVYLGAQISEDDKNRILEICRDQGIPVFSTHLKHDRFELAFNELKY